MAEEYKRAGWYPAPGGEQGERWWNGASWSDSRRGASAAPAAAPSAGPAVVPAPVASAVTVGARDNRLATIGLVLGAVGLFGLSVVSPIAIVLSLLGIARARRLKVQGGSGSSIVLATIGFAMGVIGTIILITAAIAFFAAITVDYE